jgi:hypothetical protein
MTRLSALVIPVLLAAITPADAFACDDETTLYAGQTTAVGVVTVSDDGQSLVVSYDIDGTDWAITETHVYVGEEAPKKSSPGQFDYGDSGLATFSVSYEIDLGDFSSDELVVAAHAVVQQTFGGEVDLDGLADSLPDDGDIVPQFQGSDDGYWNITFGEGDLEGSYNGWCVDTSRTMSSGQTYDIDIVSSYEDIPDGAIDHPENLDQVNYLLNQDVVGAASSGCSGTYTYGDVQRAIWELVDDNPSTAGLGSWDSCRVDELLADAAANGVGFEPGCDDEVAVVLIPVDSSGNVVAQVIIAQVTIIGVEAGCVPILEDPDGNTLGDETAWADGVALGGTEFNNKNGKGHGWGSFWTYEFCE